jgi:hypothetical protein
MSPAIAGAGFGVRESIHHRVIIKLEEGPDWSENIIYLMKNGLEI